jgi:excisionase family DNA binding protein
MQEQAIQQGLNELKQLITQTNLFQKKVLTLQEAAIYSGRSLSNLYKLSSTGILPHSKPEGKMIYIDREELERWMLRKPIRTNEEIEGSAATRVALGQKGGAKK